MTIKRRKSKRKVPLSESEAAWLVGDSEHDGFTMFLADDYLQKLWDEHGDKRRYRWTLGDMCPSPRERGRQQAAN